MRLRAATWNVHSCVGTDGRLEPARVRDVLAGLDADVIGLQEVDSRHDHTDVRDQLTYLAEQLGMHAIAGPNLRDERGEFGNGLLTRYPVVSHELVDISVSKLEPRGAIDAYVDLGRGTVRFIATHLGLTRLERATQLGVLGEHVERGAPCDATLLVGDFNEWRPRLLGGAGLLPRLFPACARPRTFPSRFPVLRLDRILARPLPQRFEAEVVRSMGARIASDHFPVVADIEWLEAAPGGRKDRCAEPDFDGE